MGEPDPGAVFCVILKSRNVFGEGHFTQPLFVPFAIKAVSSVRVRLSLAA